eukprot:3801998-Amphidinium_carterae.1
MQRRGSRSSLRRYPQMFRRSVRSCSSKKKESSLALLVVVDACWAMKWAWGKPCRPWPSWPGTKASGQRL